MNNKTTVMEKPARESRDRRREVVVTKDDCWYWVREDRGDGYWLTRGLFYTKFFAIRHAKKLSRERIVNGKEIVVWSSRHA